VPRHQRYLHLSLSPEQSLALSLELALELWGSGWVSGW
jgi:hypothetical protein